MFFESIRRSEIRLERRKIHYYLKKDMLRAVEKKLKLSCHQITEIILWEEFICQQMTDRPLQNFSRNKIFFSNRVKQCELIHSSLPAKMYQSHSLTVRVLH